MNDKPFKGRVAAECRRHPRIPLKLWVHFTARIQGEIAHSCSSESLSEDLGTAGLAMRSDQEMAAGQPLTLTLFLPPRERRTDVSKTLIYPEEECIPATIHARVAWCRALADKEYILGIQFLDLAPLDSGHLKSFLLDYKLDAPGSNLYT